MMDHGPLQRRLSNSQTQPCPALGDIADLEATIVLKRKLALLKSESQAEYDDLQKRIFSSLECKDAIEEMFAQDIVDHTWNIIRLRKAGTESIKRRAAQQERLAAGAHERAKDEKYDQELKAEVEAGIKNDSSRADAFQAMLDPIDNAIFGESRVELEIRDGMAFEASIDLQIKLDQLLNAEYKRRNDALHQFAWYRGEIWETLKKASDDAIDSAMSGQNSGDGDAESTSLVPENK